jgi:hypothetical protein
MTTRVTLILFKGKLFVSISSFVIPITCFQEIITTRELYFIGTGDVMS